MEFVPLLRWSLALAVLSVVGAPIAATVFRPLPRKGAAFSLPIALLGFAVVVFWLGQVIYGRHAVVASVVVLAAVSGLAYRYGERPDWRAIAVGSAVFYLGFLSYLTFAAHDAGITPVGGEQFLHYGLSNALVHADALPPEDFWWAGEPVRYYYGTQLQVASLSVLSGTPLRYGYYLSLGTFYGMLFVSAYGLVGSILAARDRSYHLGGVFGAVFVAIAGALTAFLRLSFEFHPAAIRDWTDEALFGALVADRGYTFAEAVGTQGTTDGWFWWNARYVIEDSLYEFPLYSLLKGDLHGHALSTGYIVLAAAIAFSYYRTPAAERGRRLALVYGGLGLVAGLFGFMNTWSLPTAVGLAWLAMAGADAHPATLLPGGDRLVVSGTDGSPSRRLGDEAWRLVLAALLALPVGVIGVLTASPFLFGGVPTNGGVGVFPPQSPFGQFLAVYGGLLALFVGLLLARGLGAGLDGWAVTRVGIVAASIALAVFPLAIDHPVAPDVLAVLGPIMLVAWWLARTEQLGFEAVLLVGGLGLLLALELVHAEVWPPDRIRWNTTLKVAVQGWTLAGAAAGAASALLVSGAVDRLREAARDPDDGGGTDDGGTRFGRWGPRITQAFPAVLALLLVAVVVATSLPFVAMTAHNNVDGDLGAYLETPTEGTIDGLATHDRWKSDQMAAIYWLDQHDSPTIVEAPSRYNYRWQNAASVFTDAVSVAGWNHQAGYRGQDVYDRRASAVEDVYFGSWENGTATLREYDVEYVYVGEGERERFGEAIRPFEAYSGLSVAFESEAVTIYAVDHAALDPTESRPQPDASDDG